MVEGIVRRILIIIFLSTMGYWSSTQSRLIILDHAAVRVYTAGLEDRKEGQPVIVFENGHGETINSWETIAEAVGQLGPVLMYDRPGTGGSEPDQVIPTIEGHSKKLNQILNALHIDPPYLLVGHSLGGVYIRGFANQYPDDLAGLIFVDPADFTQKLSDFEIPYREIGVGDAYIDSMMKAKFGQPAVIDSSKNIRVQQESELLRNLRITDFRALNEKDLPAIPVHFIVGGRFSVPPEYRSKDYDQESLFRARTRHWVENWMNVVNKSPYGRLFYSSIAGHYVQNDDPDIVLLSIQQAVKDYYKMIGQ